MHNLRLKTETHNERIRKLPNIISSKISCNIFLKKRIWGDLFASESRKIAYRSRGKSEYAASILYSVPY